jgi:hypothetical protein
MAYAGGTKFCATIEPETNVVNKDINRDKIAILSLTVLFILKPNDKNF